MNFIFYFFLITHGVEMDLVRMEGLEIRVSYSDGTPISFALVKVKSPSGKEINGETDEKGKFKFLVEEQGKWRIEIDDGLGHGIIKEIETQKLPQTTEEKKRPSQYEKLILGTGIILFISGIFSHMLARRERKSAHT